MFALCVSLFFTSAVLPPLTEEQHVAVATAIDDRDYQESAFAALVEATRALDSTTIEMRELPSEASIDWPHVLAHPDVLRGSEVVVHGRLEQSTALPRPWDACMEWFVRTPSGRVFAVYVPLEDDVQPGRQVHVAGWFYKRMQAEARDGTLRQYPAVVGRLVPSSTNTSSTWVIVLCVVGLLGGWFLARFLARSRGAGMRPRSSEEQPLDGGRASSSSEDLPTDPAEALDVLARRSEDPSRGEYP